jgi:hypothetical protein
MSALPGGSRQARGEIEIVTITKTELESRPRSSRQEHLQWCKDRALAYVDAGETKEAFTSMASDLLKHPDTADHPGILLGSQLLIAGHLDTPHKMREFIVGFN